MLQEAEKKNNWFLWLIGISVLVTILASFYSLYFQKNYEFIVEVPCDTSKETCFQRDCSDSDNCPPNKLDNFKRYSLKANDFKACSNEDCAKVCENGSIPCEPIFCIEDLESGESCSS